MLSSRCLYKNSIVDFVKKSEVSILGKMSIVIFI